MLDERFVLLIGLSSCVSFCHAFKIPSPAWFFLGWTRVWSGGFVTKLVSRHFCKTGSCFISVAFEFLRWCNAFWSLVLVSFVFYLLCLFVLVLISGFSLLDTFPHMRCRQTSDPFLIRSNQDSNSFFFFHKYLFWEIVLFWWSSVLLTLFCFGFQ